VWNKTESFTESNSTSFVYSGSHATTDSSQAFSDTFSKSTKSSFSNPYPESFNNVFGTLPTMRWQELEWTNVLRQKECMPGYQ
jgi:hypothetical protein